MDSLRLPLRPPEALYGDADGGGTNPSRLIACHIAVSEALERWAYYENRKGPDAQRFGFDRYDSTAGMAAFPGITRGAARQIASQEAAERWGVLEWWRGRLAASPLAAASPGIQRLEIVIPIPRLRVVVMWAAVDQTNMVAYGFAGHRGLAGASAKAMIELSRNAQIIRKYMAQESAVEHKLSSREQRLIFFATAQGHRRFSEKVERSMRPGITVAKTPARLVDSLIPGPWEAFATVWRVLLDNEPDDRLAREVFAF